MAAQKGSLLLIKIGNGGSPTETFTTVAGLRTTRMALNQQPVDCSNKDSGAWRQLLGNAGIRSISISGGGVFTDAASEESLRGYAFAGSVNNYKLYFGNGGILSGAFQVTSYERAGNHDGEETYNLTLESAGAVTFA